MSFFEQIKKKLFKDQKSYEFTTPLTRTRSFQALYKYWSDEPSKKQILSDIREAIPNGNNDFEIIELDTPYSKGFSIFPKQKTDVNQWELIHEYLKEQVLNENYLLQRAVKQTKEVKGRFYILDRFYIKPKRAKGSLYPSHAHFGNIEIDLITFEGNVDHLKIQQHIYAANKNSHKMEVNHISQLLKKILK